MPQGTFRIRRPWDIITEGFSVFRHCDDDLQERVGSIHRPFALVPATAHPSSDLSCRSAPHSVSVQPGDLDPEPTIRCDAVLLEVSVTLGLAGLVGRRREAHGRNRLVDAPESFDRAEVRGESEGDDLTGPGNRAERLGLLRVAPDEVGAYGLFSAVPDTVVGLVEPMRTEDAYQSVGLARHLLAVGLGRLPGAGRSRLKVSFDPLDELARRLCLGAGFRTVSPTRTYIRGLSSPSGKIVASSSPVLGGPGLSDRCVHKPRMNKARSQSQAFPRDGIAVVDRLAFKTGGPPTGDHGRGGLRGPK